MEKKTTTVRCAACGKKFELGEQVLHIEHGYFDANGKFADQFRTWGYMHKECFNRVVESPESVLEEIKSLARKKKKGPHVPAKGKTSRSGR